MNKCDNRKCRKKATFQYGENLKGKIASWCSKKCFKSESQRIEESKEKVSKISISAGERPIILSKQGAESFPRLIGKRAFMIISKSDKPLRKESFRIRIEGLKVLRTMSKDFWIVPNVV